jgi:hypothetical protein
MKIVVLIIGSLALIVVAFFVAYAAWEWYDVRKLEGFCGSIRPGNSFASLLPLAKENSINPRYIRLGIADEEQHNWVTYVPAPSTIGDTVCAIHYHQDTQIIISAVMWYD